ncbi:MAG: PadR family transcriptional regulator [Phycisphaerales bacterium]|nr:PadR family transcriptional regulator [Phycisphaerales bacterium]
MKREPSELECFVLGVVWQLGPASPYAVRKHLQDSPSTQWSASAGAIYPLMRRLEGRGLLKARTERAGKRARREYQVTARGLAALRKWVGPPMGAVAVTVAHDPLRSRARFLEALTPGQRRKWIAAARKVIDEVEAMVEAWEERYGDGVGGAANTMTMSGRIDVKSRREWLGKVEGMMAR